jgi:hypothetical protein
MTQELPNSIKEVMDGMPGAFQPEKAGGANATIQFNFSGAEPGNYTAKIADGITLRSPSTPLRTSG